MRFFTGKSRDEVIEPTRDYLNKVSASADTIMQAIFGGMDFLLNNSMNKRMN